MSVQQTRMNVFSGLLRPLQASAPKPERQDAKPSEAEFVLRRNPPVSLNYSVVAQSRSEVDSPDNSPGVSMWPYLLASAQTQRLNEISIYSEPGSTAEKMRFLYFNETALAIWAEMHKNCQVIGRMHRPPRNSTLAFGMPFSE